MTAYEFRGFISNLILNLITAGAVIAITWNDPLPWWGYGLVLVGMVILFPLPLADFKRRPASEGKVLVPEAEKRIQKT
jgi:hypothetical protein